MSGGAGAAGARPPAVEHHLEVKRTARYYTLGTPSPDTSEVWFVLHGFGQLAGYFIRNFSVLDDGRRLVVAPEALTADRSRVKAVVLGFSQGSEAACRWVSRGRASLDHFVLWAGKLAPELDSDADFEPLRRLRVSVVFGRDDPFGDSPMLGEMEGRLRGRAVPYRLIRFDGGHELDPPTLAALAG